MKRKRNEEGDTKHHRLSRHLNGALEAHNISHVPFKQHMAYNILFNDGHCTPKKIARLLTDIWIRPDWIMVAVPRCQPCKRCVTCNKESLCQSIITASTDSQSQDT